MAQGCPVTTRALPSQSPAPLPLFSRALNHLVLRYRNRGFETWECVSLKDWASLQGCPGNQRWTTKELIKALGHELLPTCLLLICGVTL